MSDHEQRLRNTPRYFALAAVLGVAWPFLLDWFGDFSGGLRGSATFWFLHGAAVNVVVAVVIRPLLHDQSPVRVGLLAYVLGSAIYGFTLLVAVAGEEGAPEILRDVPAAMTAVAMGSVFFAAFCLPAAFAMVFALRAADRR